MIIVGHQLAAFGVAAMVALWLLRGRWTHAHPRTALVLWQLSGLTLVVSTIGALLAFGLAPYRRGLVPALVDLPGRWQVLDAWHLTAVAAGLTLAGWLVVNQLLSLVSTARARARHRLLLQLVARQGTDALVVDHPVAVAYCLPGRTPRIVVSAGARRLLTDAELDAVLAHERAHARERHHLVVAPFQALRGLLPGNALLARVCETIELLVEMCADDKAARQHGREPLASALERFHASGFGGTPAGALAVATTSVQARIRRLREPGRPGFPLGRMVAGSLVVCALATSTALFAVPL
ncbi:peptidase M48-like protein [Prauserella shujinwangii]|uniref:Peptidase M48-like protein n=1 Tax=Prauserella shujinwangii TaxID=1453103 RepID=A0A2T0LN28_9PSEU|nr:M56 family metallopeptidase [Prauserella shujinwangii]PRX44559.1 peptidase M48-like protein [Prauserella shujinwangii]